MKLLAKVEDVFTIPGRGVAVIPAWLSDLKVRVGDPVQLRSPSGVAKDSQIVSVEFAKQLNGCRAAFMLSPDTLKEDAPPGTEIWLADVPTT